jgi:esterase/lipase superfamily enzyme
MSGYTVVPVFFATNRSVADTASGVDAYGTTLAASTSFGLAHVTIPRGHERGRVETPRWWLQSPRADRHVIVGSIEPLAGSAFATRLEAEAAPTSLDLLVFLHGYNVTFEQAARRAAQIAYDLRFPGVVVLFSWASAGSAFGYAADEDRAITSAEPFANLLALLSGGPWSNVHLLAHSMGNRVLTLALADHRPASFKPGEAAFVAADVYVPLFRQKLPRLLDAAGGRMTLYASRNDRALWISSLLHAAERIGHIRNGGPFVAQGVETIDATPVDTSFLGHSYFSDRVSVLDDLGTLLRERRRARERLGLDKPGGYWAFDGIGR